MFLLTFGCIFYGIVPTNHAHVFTMFGPLRLSGSVKKKLGIFRMEMPIQPFIYGMLVKFLLPDFQKK